MSYAMQPPAAAPAPTSAPRRPVSVASASALLILMAVVGLGYAIATLAIAPGTVDRFRAAAVGGSSVDVDGFVTVVWIGAALGAVLAVILFALYVVLALGLRRGSNAARIATWVVAGLGLLAGCATTATVAVERVGEPVQGSLSAALSEAYPGSWIPLNVALAVAQMLGYVLVGVLLLASPGPFFGRAPKPLPPDPFAAPGYGAPGGAVPGYGAPGVTPGYGAPGGAAPGYGAPGAPAPGYGAPGGYSPPPVGYGPPPTGGYSAPPMGGYSAPPTGGFGRRTPPRRRRRRARRAFRRPDRGSRVRMTSTGRVPPADGHPRIDGGMSPERVPLTDEDVPTFAVWSLSTCRSVGVLTLYGVRQ
jgi:hypothetical protein